MRLFAAICLVLACGCAILKSGTQKALEETHNQVRNLRLQAAFVCKPALQKCIAEKLNPCPSLQKCHKRRRQALLILESAEQAVKLGYEALETADTEGGKAVAISAVRAATGAVPDVVSLIERIKKDF